MMQSLSRVRTAAVLTAIISLAACDNLTPTQQRTLTGAAAGTAIGAGATVLTGGCVACGAAIGGAVGAGTGYILSQ